MDNILGADDWFTSNNSLEIFYQNIIKKEYKNKQLMFICETKYFKPFSQESTRYIKNPRKKYLSAKQFSKYLFFGYSPIHQSACFSYKLLKEVMPYSNNYILASDLDLFFKIKSQINLKIYFIQKHLINVSGGGISSNKTILRIQETISIYIKYLKLKFIIPIAFMIKKFLTLFICY